MNDELEGVKSNEEVNSAPKVSSGTIADTDTNTVNTEAEDKKLDSTTPTETPDLALETNNRSTARINLDRPILIRLSSGEIVKAHLINLSCGGLAFEYPAAAEPGVTLTILFQISSDTGTINIQAEGVAKHSHVKHESFITGIEFTKIAKEHVDIIENFVEYKVSNSSQLTGFAVSHRHKS